MVPRELTKRPFTLEEARRFGLERWHLEGASWKRLGPGIYGWRELDDSPSLILEAAHLRLPADAAFSGKTAAWLYKLGTKPCDPVEVSVPARCPTSMLAGLRLRRVALGREDVVTVRGFRVTSIERTLADLSAVVGLAETVVLVDTATHLRLTNVQKLEHAASRAARRAGVHTFHRAIALAEPAAESQMESRLRMVIVLGGLPKPLVQQTLYDRSGRRLGRPDLYYPHARLGIEYDGHVHEGGLAQDNRRQNALLAAGYRLLRFTAGDVYNDREKILAQVRALLNETRSC